MLTENCGEHCGPMAIGGEAHCGNCHDYNARRREVQIAKEGALEALREHVQERPRRGLWRIFRKDRDG